MAVEPWFRGDRSEGQATRPLAVADTAGAPPSTPRADSDRPGAGGRAWRPRTIGPVWQLVAVLIIAAGIVGVVVGLSSRGGGDNPGDDADARATQPHEQAVAFDQLLSGSSHDRKAVVNAVVSLKECRDLAASVATLREAAASREALVAKLDAVTVSNVPGGEQLERTLRTAWQSSADADHAFAQWGDQIAAAGCPDGEPEQTEAYTRGTRSSAAASRAKKSFVDQWNAVASRYGLEQRKPGEI